MPLAPAVGAQQGAVGQQVDAPRHAAAQAVQARQRAVVERHRHVGAGNAQAVQHVLPRFGRGEALQVVARNDPLRQLFKPRLREHGPQFGLADEHDLQQLAFCRFQVGQQAQLFQNRSVQRLRFVDHEERVAAVCVGVEKEGVEHIHIRLHRGAEWPVGQAGQAEFAAHRLQQLDHAQAGVEDVGHHTVRGQLFQEAAGDRRLAGADLARQQHEAAATAHAIQQVRQRFAVAFTQVQKAGVGRKRKWLAAQAEVRRIHVGEDSCPPAERYRASALSAKAADETECSAWNACALCAQTL